MDELAIKFEQGSAHGVAQFSRPADDQVEYRVRIARRGRHRLEHVDRGGLMIDALAEFAVPRRQFGTAIVELPSELRVVALQIGYRAVERRGHAPAPASDRTSSEI